MEMTCHICSLNLFRIRFSILGGKQITGDDLEFWNNARQQVPDYPVLWKNSLCCFSCFFPGKSRRSSGKDLA